MKRAICLLGIIVLLGGPGLGASETTHYMHPQEVFDAMQHGFVAEQAKGVHARYQWHLHGPEGGNWYVIIDDGHCEFGRDTIAHPDVTFICSDRDWVALSNGTLSGIWANVTGRLQVHGSYSLARKLEKMFP